MKIPLLPSWVRWTGVGVVGAVIIYFSLITTPSTVGVESTGPLWDKKLHFAAYGGLALAFAYATANYRQYPLRRSVGVILLVVIFGAIIEVLQGMVPVRQFSLLDLAANVFGAVLASLWFVIESRLSYWEVKPEDTLLKT